MRVRRNRALIKPTFASVFSLWRMLEAGLVVFELRFAEFVGTAVTCHGWNEVRVLRLVAGDG